MNFISELSDLSLKYFFLTVRKLLNKTRQHREICYQLFKARLKFAKVIVKCLNRRVPRLELTQKIVRFSNGGGREL